MSAVNVGTGVLIGRLAGAFVQQASKEACLTQQSPSIMIADSNKCPLGIDINSLNYNQLHR